MAFKKPFMYFLKRQEPFNEVSSALASSFFCAGLIFLSGFISIIFPASSKN